MKEPTEEVFPYADAYHEKIKSVETDQQIADLLEWTRKACKQLEQELSATRAHRNLLFRARDDANRELTRALAELRARDEAIADFDERARWRLAQLPYTGIGEP